MAEVSPFTASEHYHLAETAEYRGVSMAARFSSLAEEFTRARQQVALYDRSDRGLVVITGEDRKMWLHNLVTNTVHTLEDNAGSYAFATDVKGRVQFDVNVLCRPEAVWLDIDAASIPAAVEHLNRYLITEDVQLETVTQQYARLGVAGPQAADVAERLGVDDLSALGALANFTAGDGQTCFIRHDFTGQLGFEVLVPRQHAVAWWDRLAHSMGVEPAGLQALDALRVEAGIPWLGRDIDELVVAPETGQIARGISNDKGCYLGQEVIERMRAHNALARRLVGLRTEDGTDLALPAPLQRHGKNIGRVTSLVKHPTQPRWLGLGYIKTAVREAADIVVSDPPRAVEVVELAAA